MGLPWSFHIEERFVDELKALDEADRDRVKGYLRALLADPVDRKGIYQLPFPHNGRVYAASFADILIRYERFDSERSIVFLRLFKQW